MKKVFSNLRKHLFLTKDIWDKSDKAISVDDFQRLVTKVVEKYQEQQISLMEAGKEFELILSSSKGYYVPQNDAEALAGIIFYSERILPMFKRRKQLKRMAQRKFQQKMVYTRKEITTVRQENLF